MDLSIDELLQAVSIFNFRAPKPGSSQFLVGDFQMNQSMVANGDLVIGGPSEMHRRNKCLEDSRVSSNIGHSRSSTNFFR
ncbi:hypothetical protein BT93_H1823 [Corymbia citriodora subsp. variegata]|nr:hypothetical protein BT93_H1823 [Corymbia citriodora subsp. variegata]